MDLKQALDRESKEEAEQAEKAERLKAEHDKKRAEAVEAAAKALGDTPQDGLVSVRWNGKHDYHGHDPASKDKSLFIKAKGVARVKRATADRLVEHFPALVEVKR